MEQNYRHMAKRWKFIFLVGLLIAMLSVGAGFLRPLKYRADAQVLIISRTRYGVDPYTVVKSAERVGENLVAIMRTDDFRQKVRATEGYQIDWTKFDQLNERAQRRDWSNIVIGSVVYGTGVVNVSAYHQNSDSAKQLAGAVAQALTAQAWEYVGGDVILKVVNSPLATRWPVQPNLPLNAAVGFVAGLLLAGLIANKKT